MLSNKEIELLNKIQKRTVYENKFLQTIKDLKWFDELKKRGYFNPNIDTQPKETKRGLFLIPRWNVLQYLEKVSQQVNEPGNDKYVDELLSIIREVTNYHINHDKVLDNYYTWYYFVKILCNLPNERIPIDIIDLIPLWLDSKFDTMLQGAEIAKKLLPKFLTDNPEDIKKAEKIIAYITAIKTIPLTNEEAKIFNKSEENQLVIDPYWLRESFEKYSEIIGEKCSSNVIDDLTQKIKSILKEEYDGTYHSFYEDTEYHTQVSLETLTFFLKKILLTKAKSDVDATRKILKKFLEDKYFFFPKMGIYIIGQNVDKYKELFFEILKTNKGTLILANTLFFADELKNLLENLRNLTDKERKLLKEKIEDAAKQLNFEEEEDKLVYKQRIYSALSRDEYFKELYDKIKKITKRDAELQPPVSLKVGVGPGPSPLKKEDILGMTTEELAEYLREFKTVDYWEGPSIDGLSEILKIAVQEAPEKFIDNLTPFLNTGYLYVYHLLWGIAESLKKKRKIDWGKLLNFIKDYITPKDFWDDKYKIEGTLWDANHLWIVGMIGTLIKQGTVDDASAFSAELFPPAQEILFLLLDKMLSAKEQVSSGQAANRNFTMLAFNSPFGRLTEALIMLAFRVKKVEGETKISQMVGWEVNIRNKYEELLNNKIIESYEWLGYYLPYFYSLDKEWTKDKIKKIEGVEDYLWEAFMEGYLLGGRVYIDIYKLMKSHYEKALNYQFTGEDSSNRTVQHICIGYLSDVDDINDTNSLFRKILDKWKTDQIKEIIRFFWSQRDYKQEKNLADKIIAFWRWVYENKYCYKQENDLDSDDKEILFELPKLTVFLPEINSENFEWLKKSARSTWADPFFIEYLNNLKDKGQSINYLGAVYLEILKNATPDFKQEDIKSIVEFLYQQGKKEDANKICNIYGSRGYEFLRKLYERYNK